MSNFLNVSIMTLKTILLSVQYYPSRRQTLWQNLCTVRTWGIMWIFSLFSIRSIIYQDYHMIRFVAAATLGRLELLLFVVFVTETMSLKLALWPSWTPATFFWYTYDIQEGRRCWVVLGFSTRHFRRCSVNRLAAVVCLMPPGTAELWEVLSTALGYSPRNFSKNWVWDRLNRKDWSSLDEGRSRQALSDEHLIGRRRCSRERAFSKLTLQKGSEC